MIGYIGSYASKDSMQVMRFNFDENNEAFVDIKPVLPWKDSKYISLYGNDFVTILKKEKAGIGLWHKNEQTFEELESEDITSCFVTQDETYIYTANYHEGSVSIYKKKEHLQLIKRINIKEHAGCHQVILYKHYLIVPCLLLDKIMIYDQSQQYTLVKEIHFSKGSGPRHGVFDQKNNLYLVSELSNQLFIYHFDGINEELIQVIDLIPKEEKGAAAAIRMSKDERFLYISVRECNQIIVYDIEKAQIIQRISSFGDHPRDIALSPYEAYLFIANRFSNTLVVCRRDTNTGMLTERICEIEAIEAVSIAFEQEVSL